MIKSTKNVRNNLCQHIKQTSISNSDFAYIFAATDRLPNPKDVTYSANGDSEQIFKMLASIIHSISNSANVSETLIIRGICRELLSYQFVKDGNVYD